MRSSASSMTTELPRMTYSHGQLDWTTMLMLEATRTGRTYDLTDSDFLTAGLFFYRVVEHNVKENLQDGVSCAGCVGGKRRLELTHIVSTENTNNLSASVELDEETTVKVLRHWSVICLLRVCTHNGALEARRLLKTGD